MPSGEGAKIHSGRNESPTGGGRGGGVDTESYYQQKKKELNATLSRQYFLLFFFIPGSEPCSLKCEGASTTRNLGKENRTLLLYAARVPG